MTQGNGFDLEVIRSTLGSLRGRRYWEALDQLADSEAFQVYVREQYPSQQHRFLDGVMRRDFLKLMGASLALGGLGACTRQPNELILPYARFPEQMVPGRPLYFASAMAFGGAALGVLVESHIGRPTKIEGNPEHPSSQGATDIFAQAALLTMYDPDRSQAIRKRGRITTWPAFLEELAQAMQVQHSKQGAGLRVLSDTITSPTLNAQREQLLAAFPQARWRQWDPVNRDLARTGALLAFGEDVATHLHLDEADVVVALDADFLTCGPARVRCAREFAARRRSDRPNRLYAFESAPTLTGSSADHRLAVRASEIEAIARSLAKTLGVDVAAPALSEPQAHWVAVIAEDLRERGGSNVVVAGDAQPAAVHALAHAINEKLGNVGKTVTYTEPVELAPSAQTESLQQLVREARSGAVEVLVILSTNPALTAPPDLEFAAAMNKVPLRIHSGLYDDETSSLCHWHIPESHFLETWSDARGHDGTWSTVQPLIAPLYDSKSTHETVAALLGDGIATSYDIVRKHWQATLGTDQLEGKWRKALHDGLVANTSLPVRTPSMKKLELSARVAAPVEIEPANLELVIRPDPTIWDGRFANNGWLQELPKPFTKLTWDNVAQMGVATARRLGVQNGDVVELKANATSVRAPVFILEAHAEQSITVHLGYGRTQAGRIGTGLGFDAYRLQSTSNPWLIADVQVRKTGEHVALAATQEHHRMEGRDIARIAGVTHGHVHGGEGEPEENTSMYPPHPYDGNAWGMVIDLNTCIGCSVCTIACQAENNIPVVGKEQVAAGREMHWIRVDHYEEGEGSALKTVHQPVPCMHCENAPCEVVCPVGATVHSDEGLNEMVYNRCVGTRYCSNNCPYKVRRFNFLAYSDYETESLKLMRNPDVTVRTRGVMEKCTYCVQRISAARIQAKKEDRAIGDGEIRTACEAACPAQAIVFGNINDKESRIARLRESPHHYSLLGDLNTRPRTTYLAKQLNRNPKLL